MVWGRIAWVIVQVYFDAPVAPALLFDLADADLADFRRRAHMGPPARLQIHALDLQQANLALAPRRLHRHRADEFGLGIQLGVRDPAAADRVIAGNEFIQCRLRGLLVDGFFHIEVEPALFG